MFGFLHRHTSEQPSSPITTTEEAITVGSAAVIDASPLQSGIKPLTVNNPELVSSQETDTNHQEAIADVAHQAVTSTVDQPVEAVVQNNISSPTIEAPLVAGPTADVQWGGEAPDKLDNQ